MEYGIVIFDIDLNPPAESKPQDAIILAALYGPYTSAEEAQGRVAFVEDEHRNRYAARFGEGRYEFKLEVRQMQTVPPLQEGWL